MRCSWATNNDPLYVKYHDEEWGRPVFEDHLLFEMLCLEGAQAGLSWITILRKRDNYRRVFDQFDAKKIAHYNEQKISELLQYDGIIRNKLKIHAFINNAKSYLKIKDQYPSFAHYVWSFVDYEPIQNSFQSVNEIPASTPISDAMSKQLKKDGFKFVGPTICYAFMQATGMVNDHVISCPCYTEVALYKSNKPTLFNASSTNKFM